MSLTSIMTLKCGRNFESLCSIPSRSDLCEHMHTLHSESQPVRYTRKRGNTCQGQIAYTMPRQLLRYPAAWTSVFLLSRGACCIAIMKHESLAFQFKTLHTSHQMVTGREELLSTPYCLKTLIQVKRGRGKASNFLHYSQKFGD